MLQLVTVTTDSTVAFWHNQSDELQISIHFQHSHKHNYLFQPSCLITHTNTLGLSPTHTQLHTFLYLTPISCDLVSSHHFHSFIPSNAQSETTNQVRQVRKVTNFRTSSSQKFQSEFPHTGPHLRNEPEKQLGYVDQLVEAGPLLIVDFEKCEIARKTIIRKNVITHKTVKMSEPKQSYVLLDRSLTIDNNLDN